LSMIKAYISQDSFSIFFFLGEGGVVFYMHVLCNLSSCCNQLLGHKIVDKIFPKLG
jgi:hypothetical protein